MADKKLSEVTKVTDMAYVPVILSDGSVGQIAKADLASVVAGVMNTNDLSTFVKSSSVLSNIDEVKPNGVYAFSLSEDDANVSTLGYRYGQVSYYFNNRHWGVYQLVSLNIEFADGERLYIRRHNSDGTWQPWQRLDNFGYNSLAELATGVGANLNFISNSIALSTSADEVYTVGKNGLSIYNVSSSDTGFPNSVAGVLIHIQRREAGSVSTSQHIYQTFFSKSGWYRRTGVGDGSIISYSDWVVF